jgi:hypothetical protein
VSKVVGSEITTFRAGWLAARAHYAKEYDQSCIVEITQRLRAAETDAEEWQREAIEAEAREQEMARLWRELRCGSCNGTGQIGHDAGAPGALMYEDCTACDGSGVSNEAIRQAEERERLLLKEQDNLRKQIGLLREALERIGYREDPTDGEAAQMRWTARNALGWVCAMCEGRGSLMEPDGSKFQPCPHCGGSGSAALAASPGQPEASPKRLIPMDDETREILDRDALREQEDKQ